jgi:Fic family protein
MPRFTIERIKTELGVSFPTANAAAKLLNKLGIIKEISGRSRNRSFSYEAYIQLISQ